MTKKFGQLFEYLPKSKIKAGSGIENTTFPFYTCSDKLTKSLDEALYDSEALIFGTGGNATMHYVDGKFSTSTDCLVAKRKSDEVLTKYVYYYLFSDMNILQKGFRGSGLKHISKSYIDEIDIPIVDLEIQEKIIDVLDKITSLVSKRKEQLLALNKIEEDLFVHMFGNPLTNERTWDVSSLGECAKLERGRFSPRPRNDPRYFNGDFPYIQTGDISGCEHRLFEHTQTLNELGTKVSKEFPAGTIVIAIVGATIGATAILQKNVYAPDSVIGITPHVDKFNNVFLEMLMRFWKQWLLDIAPESARANINLNILSKVQIINVPFELQVKFAEKSIEIESQKSLLKTSLAELETTYKATLQKAFNGELF